MKNKLQKILSVFLSIVMLIGIVPVIGVNAAEELNSYQIASDVQIDVVDGAYEYISFEYQVTNDGVMFIGALSPDWGKYYGYYEFNSSGKVWDDQGVYCTALGDGFYRVVLKTSELERTNNAYNTDNAPEKIGLLYIGGSNSATGTIQNVKTECSHIYESNVTEPTTTTQGYTTHICRVCSHSYVDSYVEPLDVSYEIKADLNIDVEDGVYDYISFEYQVTNDEVLFIGALSPDWNKYYGYYEFNGEGKVWDNNGVYCSALGDGFYRVILKTAELDRTNNEPNINNKPDRIGLLYTGSSAATGTIRKVKTVCSHIYESVITEPTATTQGYTTHTCIVCGDSYVDSYVEIGTTAIGADVQIDVVDSTYMYISFEYQITNDGVMYIGVLSPDWGKYYGYYEFDANGKVWEDNGIYCEPLADGFYRVTMKTSELNRTNNAYNTDNAPETIGLLYISSSNTATGTIRNVQVAESEKYNIATGAEIKMEISTYDYISFDYKVTNDGVLFIGALSPDWGKYYGYYELNAGGKVWEDKGVYCAALGDGFYRVILKASELERTNNAYNTANAPETIGLLLVGGSNTATGTITNVQGVCSHITNNVFTAPTFENGGHTTSTCSVCGESWISDETSAYTASVSTWNIALGDEISAKFYLNVDSRILVPTAKITIDSNTTDVPLIKQANGTYAVTVNLAAAQMTENIAIQVVAGEAVSDTMNYTIRQYAQTILNGDYADSEKELVKAMLNYGAAAQVYFDYNTSDLANAGYEITEHTAIPSVDTTNMVSGSTEGITFYGASLVFRSQVAVRFYFNVEGDINDYSFSTGNAPVYKDGMYYIEVPGINPQDYDVSVALTVNDSLTINYSPLAYISRMYSGSSNANLTALVAAMYEYYLAAEAYI